MAARKDALARQQIAASAPSGLVATPLNFIANLAGSMADTGNIALAFVPFAGEVKAASLAGRAGERFLTGAKAGLAQSALTTPFTAQAAALEGDDFTTGNAMESVFFNTVAGGLMHAGGGLISDYVQGKRDIPASSLSEEKVANDTTAETTPFYESPIGNAEHLYDSFRDVPAFLRKEKTAQPVPTDAGSSIPEGVDIPNYGTQQDLAGSINRSAQDYAYSRTYDDVVKEYVSGVEKPEIREAVSRGDIPDALREKISARANEILEAMNLFPSARSRSSAVGKVNGAHWSVNQQAYRAAVSHMMDGRTPDIEPFYDLNKPALRENAIQRIQNPVRYVDRESEPVSAAAEQHYKESQKPDHEFTSAKALLNKTLYMILCKCLSQ